MKEQATRKAGSVLKLWAGLAVFIGFGLCLALLAKMFGDVVTGIFLAAVILATFTFIAWEAG
jgi:predicted permease